MMGKSLVRSLVPCFLCTQLYPIDGASDKVYRDLTVVFWSNKLGSYCNKWDLTLINECVVYMPVLKLNTLLVSADKGTF